MGPGPEADFEVVISLVFITNFVSFYVCPLSGLFLW
jgi:hypothetical protein